MKESKVEDIQGKSNGLGGAGRKRIRKLFFFLNLPYRPYEEGLHLYKGQLQIWNAAHATCEHGCSF